MSFAQILLLAVVQGLAELLPISSSAHVIVAEKLMGLDPADPRMTFLLVMLHTGTMFAVLAYFWKRWAALLSTRARATAFIRAVLIATICTGAVGLALKKIIERILLGTSGAPHAEVEYLFGKLPLIAAALAAAGVLILIASRARRAESGELDTRASVWIGVVQGLCLPFRGFSRSGATISAALLRGIPRALAEDFSFALAVVLTPPVIALELHRLLKTVHASPIGTNEMLRPGLIGMGFSFLAGLAALKWLSAWLEKGRWNYFGYYCLAAAAGVVAVQLAGF